MKRAGVICVFIILFLLFHVISQSQTVRIGTIDVYGNRKISSQIILENAALKEGDSIDNQVLLNKKIEKSVEKIPGVLHARTAMICCDKNGNYHLFIGIAESDSSILKHRGSPKLMIKLPEKYTNAYNNFSEKLSAAIQANQSDEDWSNGYSLINYAPARRIQEKFVNWADEDFTVLSKVLRSSSFADQRATAAQIIAYNPDKTKVIPELMFAIDDESDEVRNNAIRALAVIGYYSAIHPEKKLKIPYRPFIRLINSLVWSDRNKGLAVLMQLSWSRDKELFRELKNSALASLKEMAIWKSKEHAIPAFMILGRMAGIPEDELFKVTTAGNFSLEAAKLADSIK